VENRNYHGWKNDLQNKTAARTRIRTCKPKLSAGKLTTALLCLPTRQGRRVGTASVWMPETQPGVHAAPTADASTEKPA